MHKNKSIFAAGLIYLFLLLQPYSAHAQYDNVGILFRSGAEDAETLLKAYLSPLASGIGGGLNTGWFNSASAHRTLGFSIQIRGSVALVPQNGRQFDLSKLSLQHVRAANKQQALSPTIAGDDRNGAEVVVTHEGREAARFNLPRGTGYHFVPAPMLQASVGLIKNTDVIVRFIPEVQIGEYGTMQVMGIGLKHELTQWLPAENIMPLDISIMAGYTHIDLNAGLHLEPQTNAEPDPDYNGSYDNQKIASSFDTFTAKLIAGKSLPFLDVFAAAGYQHSTMAVALTGDYPVPARGSNGQLQTDTVTDPFKYSRDGDNSFSLSAGAAVKLFFFDIFAQYTWSHYSVFNAGIAFSFR